MKLVCKSLRPIALENILYTFTFDLSFVYPYKNLAESQDCFVYNTHHLYDHWFAIHDGKEVIVVIQLDLVVSIIHHCPYC